MSLTAPKTPLGRTEFVALSAMLFATIALSVDGMLPALPQIAAELTPQNANNAQLVVTIFVLGMGIGTLLTGPLSDAFGRRPVLLSGAVFFCIGALLAAVAPSLEMLLAARLIQGLGAAGPRVVAMAIVRDLFAGREMARIMSFVMLVFTLVPAMAPLMGAAIISVAGWRGVFVAFVIFVLISGTWFFLRQPETLPVERRRPFRARALWAGCVEVMKHKTAALATLAQAMVMGMLFAAVSTVQPVFDVTYGRAAEFPFWFCGIALISGSASVLNSRIVVRLGMRTVVARALTVQAVFSAIVFALCWMELKTDWLNFAIFVIWLQGIFFMLGLTIGNLNALAMEPMGHLAGLAASIVGAVATVVAVFIAIPIGLAFDGTPLWLVAGACICALAGRLILGHIPADQPIAPLLAR